MNKRRALCAAALLATVLAVVLIPALTRRTGSERVPGAEKAERRLLRVWMISSPGGGDGWVREQLAAFEAANPGLMTYLRQATPAMCMEQDVVLPDVILFMPGDFVAPEELFVPLSGVMNAQEAALRSGRWQGQQYALPLCYGGYLLAVDASYTPDAAQTPAPTTLLGRPAATPEDDAATPPVYPAEAVAAAEDPLQAPSGAGLFALTTLLADARPHVAEDFGTLSAGTVYSRFVAKKCASALLTTGQYAALCELISAGRAFPVKTFVPDTVVTDQVLLGGVVRGGSAEGAALLGFLTSSEAQKALGRRALFSVAGGTRLYASGESGQVEAAAGRSLTMINAFVKSEDTAAAAWQCWQGTAGLSEALLPLL